MYRFYCDYIQCPSPSQSSPTLDDSPLSIYPVSFLFVFIFVGLMRVAIVACAREGCSHAV